MDSTIKLSKIVFEPQDILKIWHLLNQKCLKSYHYLYLMSKLCEFCAKLQNMKVFLKMLTNQNCFWIGKPTHLCHILKKEKHVFSRVFTDIGSLIVR